MSRLLAQLSRPPSQTWRTFHANHVSALVLMDFLTISTRTAGVTLRARHHLTRPPPNHACQLPERRTSAWTAQQLVESFPEDTAPRRLMRDRDSIYDDTVRRRIASLGITSAQDLGQTLRFPVFQAER